MLYFLYKHGKYRNIPVGDEIRETIILQKSFYRYLLKTEILQRVICCLFFMILKKKIQIFQYCLKLDLEKAEMIFILQFRLNTAKRARDTLYMERQKKRLFLKINLSLRYLEVLLCQIKLTKVFLLCTTWWSLQWRILSMGA